MADYAKKTVAELQEILKSRSLPHSGKKADLIARLHEADKTSKAPIATPGTTTTSDPVASSESAPAVAKPEITSAPAQVPPTTANPDTKTTAPQTDSANGEAAPTAPGSTTVAATTPTPAEHSAGPTSTAVDAEMKKRQARAARFGTGALAIDTTTSSGPDAAALALKKRAERFGTHAGVETGVSKLDTALPERRAKRGRGEDNNDDPGLRQVRGGGTRVHGPAGGRSRSRRGADRPTGVQRSGLSEKDRLAAEARKKRFAAMS